MGKVKTVALYAGSFDPITRGHLDIVDKALATFDEVHLSIGINPAKKRLFVDKEAFIVNFQSLMEHFNVSSDVKPKFRMGKSNYEYEVSHPDVPVVLRNFTGSITQHAKELGATHLVRGLRQASDFNDEFSLTGVVGHVNSDLIMTHFICNERFLHISSSTARELAKLDENTDWLVTPTVSEQLRKKYHSPAY